jgi:hypothetical protein
MGWRRALCRSVQHDDADADAKAKKHHPHDVSPAPATPSPPRQQPSHARSPVPHQASTGAASREHQDEDDRWREQGIFALPNALFSWR